MPHSKTETRNKYKDMLVLLQHAWMSTGPWPTTFESGEAQVVSHLIIFHSQIILIVEELQFSRFEEVPYYESDTHQFSRIRCILIFNLMLQN